jgi:mRNA-degrading endonuclease YafQ of YafQ-DinJ toxin-antitoxin module
MMVKRVNSSTAFEKDIEKLNRRYKDMEKLKSIVRSLVNGEKLDQIWKLLFLQRVSYRIELAANLQT